MKLIIALLIIVFISACDGNSGTGTVSDSSSVNFDSPKISPSTIITDTTGGSRMNVDTTGMGNAR